MLGMNGGMMGYCSEGEYVLDLRTTGSRSEGKASPAYEADSGYSASPQGSPSPPASPHGLVQRLASPPHTPPASPDPARPAALVQRVLDAPTTATRPFKAYPRNPLVLGGDEAFLQFRERMLSKVRSAGKGCGANKARPCGGSEERDAAYWERRRKNNEAAKRSRDARRAKEDEIAIRAAFLEQENMRLKYEMASLKEESAALRALLYSSPPEAPVHPLHHLPLYHH